MMACYVTVFSLGVEPKQTHRGSHKTAWY